MEIDIRKASLTPKISVIRFSSPIDDGVDGSGFSCADCVRIEWDGQVFEVVETNTEDYVRLYSKQQARNLIKALEKALELCPEMREV